MMRRTTGDRRERRPPVLFKELTVDAGQTVVQLLVGLVVAGVLLAAAIIGYGRYQKDRADREAAVAVIRQALPAVQAFYLDNRTYEGMTLVSLILRDPNMPLRSSPTDLRASTYCIKATVRGKTAWKANRDGAIVTTKPPGCTE